MSDQYDCFKELESGETKTVDYDIRAVKRDSPVAIIAPHGGHIEPHTTLIAESIADNRYNFYSFMGLKPRRPHRELHITSAKFDEPCCISVISNCDTVIAVHGRADRIPGDKKRGTPEKIDPKTIFLGGLDTLLRDGIAKTLNEAGFEAEAGNPAYPGEHLQNICNQGRTKRGVQLEIPRSLRDLLEKQPDRLTEFASAIKAAIERRD
jgi:phage replication-related protein YjqB (UPF0714/DUF867 family)